MMSPSLPAALRATALDRAAFAEFRDGILRADAECRDVVLRSYPGYPAWPLEPVRRRVWPPLDRALARRRSARRLGVRLPSRRVLSRVLGLSHGVTAPPNRGPVPSAGGLQALELYVVALHGGWLPAGAYHYGRAQHSLAGLGPAEGRAAWEKRVPSLRFIEGGALLWVIAGDAARVEEKYGARGARFLLLEAGHLMQNLCLVSAAAGLSTVPLGGFFESEIASAVALPRTDAVLYAGVCG